MPSDFQALRLPDAGEFEQLRRRDRAGRHDHLARGARLEGLALHHVTHADAARAFEQQALRMRAGLDTEVAPRARRIEIDLRGAHAEAAADRGLRHRNAFLVLAVVVGIVRNADALGRRDQAVVERAALVAVGDLQRAAAAAQFVRAARIAFDAPENRQHVVPAPAAVAQLRPVIVVLRLAAHPHHAVDRARSAEHLAARHRDVAPAGRGLGLGLVEPVHARAIDEAREADRHARERMRLAARFQQQHLMAAVLGQAIGERGAGRACSDDDVVGRADVHGVSVP